MEGLIAIDPDLPCLHQVKKELSQPTYKSNSNGKILIDKKPNGVRSPNLGDAIMMSYHLLTSLLVVQEFSSIDNDLNLAHNEMDLIYG